MAAWFGPAAGATAGNKVWFDPTEYDVKRVGEGMIRHGDQGEVMGPASPGDYRDTGETRLLVQFTGVHDFVPVDVREVRTAARTALYIYSYTSHTLCPYGLCSPRPGRPPLTVHGAQTGYS